MTWIRSSIFIFPFVSSAALAQLCSQQAYHSWWQDGCSRLSLSFVLRSCNSKHGLHVTSTIFEEGRGGISSTKDAWTKRGGGYGCKEGQTLSIYHILTFWKFSSCWLVRLTHVYFYFVFNRVKSVVILFKEEYLLSFILLKVAWWRFLGTLTTQRSLIILVTERCGIGSGLKLIHVSLLSALTTPCAVHTPLIYVIILLCLL